MRHVTISAIVVLTLSLTLLTSQAVSVAAPPTLESALVSLTDAIEPSMVKPVAAQADATVQSAFPGAASPDNLYLATGYYDGSWYDTPPYNGKGIARFYVKFDLSSIPAASQIISATFGIRQMGGVDYPGVSRSIGFYRVTADWTEAGLTWNSRPSYAEQVGAIATTYDYSGWSSLDLTSLARAWLAGTTPNYGLVAITDEDEESIHRLFASGESTEFPRLAVSYVAMPDASAPPVLDVFPGQIVVDTGPSQPPSRLTLQVSNVTTGTLAFQVAEIAASSWLTLPVMSGIVSPTHPATLTVLANPRGLTNGPHSWNLWISSPTAGVANSPISVTVTLDVHPRYSVGYLPLAMSSAPAAPPPAGKTMALIVGISDYLNYTSLSSPVVPDGSEGGDLYAPAFDAADFQAYLLGKAKLGAGQVTTLIDDDASYATIAAQFDRAARSFSQLAAESRAAATGGPSTFIFYFSGHGGQVPDKNGDEKDHYDEFISAYDANLEKAGGPTGIFTDDDLARLMARIPADRIVVIMDTCFAGGMAQTAGEALMRGVTPSVEMDAQPLGDLVASDRLIITGGTGNQATWESQALKNGVFTEFFLQALENRGYDANHNGRISLEEAYWFSRKQVSDYVKNEIPDGPAHPQDPYILDRVHGQVDLTWLP